MGLKHRGTKKTNDRLIKLTKSEGLFSPLGARVLAVYLRYVSPVYTGHMQSTITTRKAGRLKWIVVIPQSRYQGWFYAVKFARFFTYKARGFKRTLKSKMRIPFKKDIKKLWRRIRG